MLRRKNHVRQEDKRYGALQGPYRKCGDRFGQQGMEKDGEAGTAASEDEQGAFRSGKGSVYWDLQPFHVNLGR